ncbi:MAG: type IV secretory system conjugative DNA transfer family protein [Salinarimonas sp.]
MHPSTVLGRCLALSSTIILLLLFGYPAAFTAIHGLNPAVWPALPETPGAWFSLPGETPVEKAEAFGELLLGTYLDMASGVSDALPGGGRPALFVILTVAVAAGTFLFTGPASGPRRHYSNLHGNARFASRSELAGMKRGLELGIDPESRKAVRVLVEGNLLTIAPPRSGKTSGLILPNLVFSEAGAWAGPAVVVDPKGDVFRAVRRRREALGRRVLCLDPLGLAGGADRWNPLLERDPKDTIHLQAMARALLPDGAQTSDSGMFFKDRAVAVIVAALSVAIESGRGDMIEVANLINKSDDLVAALSHRTDRVARDALDILSTPEDDRTRNAILATVGQAFSWAADERIQATVKNHTFELKDLCGGDTDLFIVLPADDRREILAPYVRMLLADLFATVRTHRPVERMVVFIDEAFVLGRFDAVLRGSGELPGYGVSLWTFWQTENQLIEAYGPSGADTIRGTAEAVILFNLSRAQAAECRRWSETLGTFSGVEPQSRLPNGKQSPDRPIAQPLVRAADLPEVTRTHSIVMLTSERHLAHPLKLAKTRPHRDRRFAGLIDAKSPVGAVKA